MIPRVGMQPDPLRARRPLAAQCRGQQPRPESAALRLGHQAEMLEFDLGKRLSLELAESERRPRPRTAVHLSRPQHIDVQRSAGEE